MRILNNRSVAGVGSLCVAAIVVSGAWRQQPHPKGATAPPLMLADSREDRLARALIQASPLTDPTDAKARDAAGERLVRVKEFLDVADDEMLWGGFEAVKGYDPKAYRLTEFSPMVWAKLYLSTFMFTGGYQVSVQGRFTVIELAVKFRDGLDSGDYPYPFWHSQKKWDAYSNAVAVILVVEKDRLIAAYRKAGPPPATPPEDREWDGRWRWTGDDGGAEPRVALFSYFFSSDNPHAARLDATYRSLEAKFRAQNCMSCHAPDNTAQADRLVLLNYPNQALAARHSLAAILRGNKMPPADEVIDHPGGLTDEQARLDLISLANAFEQEADAALAFEQARKQTSTGGSQP
jgi:hypothetical protein